ncbi:hypothetical protein AVDCRST_MAG94-7060 [uncultured Leptolyngbya sp.]|uniref:F5/8 type C domain-containing protein n=1 Tax=uncultured Leptolyngbya sp. TaxID=332963 RepID=A0A6J4PP98_9CYAN|nr:hypothetical protein AVDCRST_MAG94-7060 [uncultured Leptolyngbya sp.]
MINQAVLGAVAASIPPAMQGSAAGQVYTVSSSPGAIDVPTYAGLTDGTTAGAASTTQGSDGQSLKATFDFPVIVTTITLGGGFAPNLGSAVSPFLNGRNVQHSSNNVNWTTAFVVSGVTDSALKTFTLDPPITAQYWRIALDTAAYVATTEFSFT